jgi:DNA-binding NarL/FixJ family response regulator
MYWSRSKLVSKSAILKNAAMRVLIADDHAIFRQGLRAVLGSLSDDATVDEAGDLSSALKSVADQPPDIILLDLRMPGMDGFNGIGTLRKRIPRAPIVVLSASEDSEDVFQSLSSGASGYLAKSASASTIIEALRLVLVGGIYVPRDLVSNAETTPLPTSVGVPRLTRRQSEVLAFVVDGRSNKEIAHLLKTSEGTIKAHVTAIMRMLGVRNRVQILLAAERAGLRTQAG